MNDEERTLEIVTKELGEADALEKSNKKKRDKHRLEFFALASESKKTETLARQTVSVAEYSSEDEAREHLERLYPTWRIIDFDMREDDIVAVLEEDPEKQPFVFINPEDGKVYRKQVIGGLMVIDEDWLKREDPKLWERITFEPKVERQIKTQEDIEAEDLAKMQRYMYPSEPTLKLAAPRKASEQELETGHVDDP